MFCKLEGNKPTINIKNYFGYSMCKIAFLPVEEIQYRNALNNYNPILCEIYKIFAFIKVVN